MTSSSSGAGQGAGRWPTPWPARARSILLLERGNFLPREMDNWDPEPVFIDGKYISKDTWYDADGKPFQPQVHYNVGGATKLYGAALYRLRPQDFGEHPPRRRPLAGVAVDLRRLRAVVHARPSGSTRCTATPARIQPKGRARSRTRGPQCRTSHGSSSSPTSSRRGGYHPFHAPCGILLDEADRARSTCIRCTWCDGYPCLVHAKADAETIAVRPLLGAAERDVARRRRGRQARDRRGRPHGDRRRRVPRRPARGVRGRHRRRVGRGVELGQAAAALGQRPPSQRPGQRLGSGGSELHVPQLQGHRRPGQGAERHRLPEDGRAERLLPRRPRLRVAGREHPDDRQVERRGHEGRRTEADQARAALLARRGGPATPSTSGSRPRTCPNPRTG